MINPTSGKNIEDFRPRDQRGRSKFEIGKILIPYLILIGTQIPLSLVYLIGLWSYRSHYVLMPIAILATAGFVYFRWPRSIGSRFFPSVKSDLLLLLGILLGVLGSVLLSPWMAFASLLSLSGSLLARTNDRHVFGSLLSALAPLVVLLQPPAGIDFDTVQGDILLINWIHITATGLASDALDLTQYVHNVSGSVMELPQGLIDATQLGHSALSVFSLLILTGIFIAWQRRPLFRGALLLVAACFWFMAFEALHLFLAAIALQSFEQDWLNSGFASGALQVVGLVGAGIMTVLTDSLLTFLFGPVDVTAIDEDASYQNMIRKLWNRAIAGEVSPVIDVNDKKEVAWAKRRNSAPSRTISALLWTSGVGLVAFAVISVIGLQLAWSRSGNYLLDRHGLVASESLLPDRFEPINLTRTDYRHVDPESSSQWHDYRWTFALSGGDNQSENDENHRAPVLSVSIRYPQTGWQPLIDEARSHDWNLLASPETRQFEIGELTLDVVVAQLRNSLAEYRVVYYTSLDGYLDPANPPSTWTDPVEFFQRAGERMSKRNRPRIFSDQMIQISVSLQTIGPPDSGLNSVAESLFREVVAEALDTWRDTSSEPVTGEKTSAAN